MCAVPRTSKERRRERQGMRVLSTSALDRPTFLNSLANRSLCFLGPANTSCAVQRELCSACEVLFITNNMVTLIEALPCLSMVLVTNRFFGHRVLANSALAANASAVLCTYGPTCQAMVSRGVHNRTLLMAHPAVRTGSANSLAYVLKAVCDINGYSGCAPFSSMHITGVTFYDRGGDYMAGYQITNESTRHDAEANKAYVLAWVKSIGRRATIDYPRCLPVDALAPHKRSGSTSGSWHSLARPPGVRDRDRKRVQPSVRLR